MADVFLFWVGGGAQKAVNPLQMAAAQRVRMCAAARLETPGCGKPKEEKGSEGPDPRTTCEFVFWPALGFAATMWSRHVATRVWTHVLECSHLWTCLFAPRSPFGCFVDGVLACGRPAHLRWTPMPLARNMSYHWARNWVSEKALSRARLFGGVHDFFTKSPGPFCSWLLCCHVYPADLPARWAT